MTAKEAWKFAQIEQSKINSPSLLLSEFNYYINKAIQQVVNKSYTQYEVNQQTSDALRVLELSQVIPVTEKNLITSLSIDDILGIEEASYQIKLPKDYLHLLSCICIYKISENNQGCYNSKKSKRVAATKLTSDIYPQIINNYYLKPSVDRPYYYINNIKESKSIPNQPEINIPIISDKLIFGNKKIKEAGTRYGNVSNPILEIRYGDDHSTYELIGVLINYIRTPQFVELTQSQIDFVTTDTSQVLEFPDYINQEILNELVMLLMERAVSPRTSSQASVSQSIGQPIQQSVPQYTPKKTSTNLN